MPFILETINVVNWTNEREREGKRKERERERERKQ